MLFVLLCFAVLSVTDMNTLGGNRPRAQTGSAPPGPFWDFVLVYGQFVPFFCVGLNLLYVFKFKLINYCSVSV